MTVVLFTARMHPEEIDGYDQATEGERRVFRFLQAAAKPNTDFTGWYQSTLGGSGKEPDFILFGAKLGLLILEVKDWASHQIILYNPHKFTIQVSGKTETKTRKTGFQRVHIGNSLEPKQRAHSPAACCSEAEYGDPPAGWGVRAVAKKNPVSWTGREFQLRSRGSRITCIPLDKS
jgi:hypothetical protein